MSDLRVAVLGVGVMGADHVARLSTRISGARVAVVNDYVTEKAEQIAAGHPRLPRRRRPARRHRRSGCRRRRARHPGPDPREATAGLPGARQARAVREAVDHRCRDVIGVVKREAELGKRLIQVGFMRRFDHEYARLKALLDGGELGRPLVLHCAHRNPAVPPTFDSAMVVRDSLVHEVDVTRFLFDEEITSIQIIKPAANPGAPQGLADPQIAIMRTASGKHVDVELFVTTGVAYEVRTEVVAEKGSAMIGLDVGLVRKSAPGTWGGQITPGFRERFGQAYDTEFQRWVDAVQRGGATNNRRSGRLGRLRRRRGVRGRRRVAQQRTARRGQDGRPRIDHGSLT